MARLGAQTLAVNPALRKRRRGYVADIQARRGQATQAVLDRKANERYAKEQEFAEAQGKENIRLGKESIALKKEGLAQTAASNKAAKRAGQIGTGISLGTLGMNMAGTKGGVLGGNMPAWSQSTGTWGQGLGAAAMGAGVGQLVNTSKKWKKAAVGGIVGGLLGSAGGYGGGALGAIGGALGGFI